MIRDPELVAYADTLSAAGFTIYEPTRSPADWFTYSRLVDGQECFGSVQREGRIWPNYSHSMPLKPSAEHGSSMWVAGVDDGPAHLALTVEAAQCVARPFNTNKLVGRQANYRDDYWNSRLYTRREPITS
jgi:hypothetical protein